MVCLLLGSTALLGYETGAASPLMQQMALHLDRHLEFLLGELTAHRAPAVSTWCSRPRTECRPLLPRNPAPAWRWPGEAAGAGHPAKPRLRRAPQIEKYVYPFLYLDPGPGRDPEPRGWRRRARRYSQPAVAGYYTAGGACPVSGRLGRALPQQLPRPRSGDVMLSYRPEYVEDFGAGRGISYGSLYNYDACVPLCFYGPQFRAAVVRARRGERGRGAHAGAALGGARLPPPSDSVLGEAFAENVESKK